MPRSGTYLRAAGKSRNKTGRTPLDVAFGIEDVRLSALARDIVALERGWRPGPRELADAPVLDLWHSAAVRTVEPVLVGSVYGHPELPGTGRRVVTSRIAVLAPDGSWARTWSRLYRLGRPDAGGGTVEEPGGR